MLQVKDFGAKVKAVGEDDGLETGQVRALVSVFGNIDSVGDVVMPGAFKDDLARWSEKGDSIPFIWSHDWADPFSHLGRVLKAEETEAGLEVLAQIDDLEENGKALQVYRLLKGRRVTQFSFAYDVQESSPGKRDDRDVLELRKLQVYEVGPTLLGANQETELFAAKARQLVAGAKAGRVLSQSNYGRLSEAHEAIGAVLAAATPAEDEDDTTGDDPAKSSASTDAAKTEEPSQAESHDEDPRGGKSALSVPRRALAVARITNLLT